MNYSKCQTIELVDPAESAEQLAYDQQVRNTPLTEDEIAALPDESEYKDAEGFCIRVLESGYLEFLPKGETEYMRDWFKVGTDVVGPGSILVICKGVRTPDSRQISDGGTVKRVMIASE